MFGYDATKMKGLIWEVIVKNTSAETQEWLQKLGNIQNGTANFNTAFILAPRKTGKAIIHFSKAEKEELSAIRSGFSVDGWAIDRLCRVWLLLQLDATDKDKYFRTIENLFLAAEMMSWWHYIQRYHYWPIPKFGLKDVLKASAVILQGYWKR